MRHGLADVVIASMALGGCSLLYNPNDLPKQVDAMPDMEMVVDADPTALALTSVGPLTLLEGQGDGGSRQPVLVIEGTNITQVGVTVEVVAAAGAAKTPMITLDTANMQIDVYGHHIAIPITLPVDPNLLAADVIPLDVRVTQDAGGTPVTQTLSGMLTLQGLAEYTNTGAAVPALVAGVNKFSRVALMMGTIPKPPSGPVLIEATASITIESAVVANFDGSVTAAGPGGNNGGPGAQAQLLSATAGTDGDGPAKGSGGAQAGGAATAYEGDDQLTTINTAEKLENASSGGGGGGVPAVSLTPGGRGGGGGGTVSFAAGGDVTIETTVSAKGSAGQSGGNFANPGGAGSGGIILVRGGGNVMATMLDVGGPGVAGRARVDAGGTRSASGSAYQGPTFSSLPYVFNQERPTFEVVGTPSKGIRYLVIRGTDIEGPIDLTMGSNGKATIALSTPLRQGLNEICLLVEAASAATQTRNCATVAHIFK